MNTLKKSISIAISVMLVFSNLAWAGKCSNRGECYKEQPGYYDYGLVLPEIFSEYSDNIQHEIDMQNDLEFFNQDIRMINYNENGLIESVKYDDFEVKYSYEYNDDGTLKACILETEDVTIVIRSTSENSKLGPGENPFIIEIYIENENEEPEPSSPLSSGGGNEPEPAVTISYPAPDITLEDIATKPIKFDFKEIKNAVTKVREEKEAAYEEYIKNTELYYEKVYSELKTKFGFFKGAENENLNVVEKRELIDNAVAEIRSEQEVTGDENEVIREFLVFEEQLRAEYLLPGKEIYDKKIEKALEYVDAMIDKLLTSKLALYLNKKEDKLDAIINLPKEE